jgi:class 3 adenylate cyclase/tetratricopeptide (TPR) repeat protein
VQCPQCRAENRPDRRFCSACGAALPRACPACGFLNEPAARFCGGCGTAGLHPSTSSLRTPGQYTPPHLAERILNERSALEGERKQVTVLFADLKGSLELLVDRDPEDARRLLDPVLERMMAAVHQYEGTVNQVMGDGIMALFGAPVAHEDHAVRAGYAALKMQESIAAYASQQVTRLPIDLHIRVGLNSGEVVVRAINNDLKMDYSAVGQTTHLASRMEQMASPGTILATEAFARLAEGRLHFKPLGLMAVKGLVEPVDVLELVDAEPTRARFQAAAGRGLTRFVGRAPELTVIHRARARAAAGHGQAVAVIGDPGVGKSRLFYEFADSDAVADWLTIETGSVSYEKATAFLPIRDLLLGYLRVEDRDDPDRIEQKLAGRLLALDESLAAILPAMRSLLDLPVRNPQWETLDPAQRRQRILDGVKRLLVRESQAQPLLLIFENLHWIDAQTQAFLDSLMDSVPTTRMLVLLNYRPEYQHTWGNRAYYTQLRLDPLTPDTAEELLEALLGGDRALLPLKRLLIQRTEGNPFFLEESVRTLVEQRVLVGERGSRRATQPIEDIRVPATVQAILAARIDHLPAEYKRLLQCAAVIGKDLSLPLLQAVASMPETELQTGLAHLQAGEFLYETALFPEIEYTFKHALTHEVAYGSLLHDRRRALHARILEAMEQLYPDRAGQVVERLAHHAFRGESWETALTYSRQAGTKAALRSAYREAVASFEQALAALRHLPETIETLTTAFDLRLELRPWLVPLAAYERIFDNLQQAEGVATALNDRRRLGLVHTYMTDYLRLTGRSQEAVARGRLALSFAEEVQDTPLLLLATVVAGHACHAVGDYRRAVGLLRDNVSRITGDLVRQRFGSAALPAVLSRSYMIFSLADLGEFDEAVRIGQEAIQLAEQSDTAHSQVLATHSLGLAYLIQGNLERAIPVVEQTYRHCQEARIPLGARLLASALGYAYLQAGRVEESIPLLEESLRQAETLKVYFRYALWRAWLGEAYLAHGQTERAREMAERAAEHARRHGEVGHEAQALWLSAEIARRDRPPRPESAETDYQRARELADRLGMRPLHAHCRLGLARLYGALGDAARARHESTAAAEEFGALAMTSWVERAGQTLTVS